MFIKTSESFVPLSEMSLFSNKLNRKCDACSCRKRPYSLYFVLRKQVCLSASGSEAKFEEVTLDVLSHCLRCRFCSPWSGMTVYANEALPITLCYHW